MDIVERLRRPPIAPVAIEAADEIDRLRAALEEIRDRHIGDCPASLDITDEQWARRCHQDLRLIARDALRTNEQKGEK